ncbi:Fanconi anemia group J protein [Babesia caballi]|uniref:Fanconi anemia group J protein n=1 Tax=Babesia caballi TaxID=5871 RepID=A0AAV4LLL1_BABCB|nr:Fanconi anemia group J protein [Babesia caballi]
MVTRPEETKEATGTEAATEYKRSVPYIAAVTVGAVFWGYIITKRVNRMLIGRYDNVVYQIRRAESLSNRYAAFKFFVLGGAVVPTATLGALYAAYRNQEKDGEGKGARPLKAEAAAASKAASDKLAGYASNANKRLELIAEGVRGSVLAQAGPRMAEDLRRDVAAVKRWIRNLF